MSNDFELAEVISEISGLYEQKKELDIKLNEQLLKLKNLLFKPQKWDSAEENFVMSLHEQGLSNKEIALKVGRTEGSIRNKVSGLK